MGSINEYFIMKHGQLKRQITKIFPKFLLKFFKELKQNRIKAIVIQNINIKPCLQNQKRVLISYITDSLLSNCSKWDTSTRQKECSVVIGSFIDQGYTVDVIGCNDQSNFQSIMFNHYDVIFGFGSVFYEMCKRQPNANRILYLTEKHPDFSARKEMERNNYFFQRHNKRVSCVRSGLFFQKEHFDVADSIIFVGTEADKQILPVKVPCYSIAPTGLSNNEFNVSNRNVSDAKKNFLWLGSMGAIHKGLDILIDVFQKQEESVLHIAGLNSIDRKTLQHYSNTACILDHGFLNAQSSEFCTLMTKCGYLIFPSCSEALSTAVITGMNFGLIPIITPETSFELPNIGAYLLDYSVEYKAEIVKTYANKNDEWIIEQQNIIIEYSKENFSIYRYSNRFNEILKLMCI